MQERLTEFSALLASCLAGDLACFFALKQRASIYFG